jgi:hypothetical protein
MADLALQPQPGILTFTVRAVGTYEIAVVALQ